jgi:hypothetical protein
MFVAMLCRAFSRLKPGERGLADKCEVLPFGASLRSVAGRHRQELRACAVAMNGTR